MAHAAATKRLIGTVLTNFRILRSLGLFISAEYLADVAQRAAYSTHSTAAFGCRADDPAGQSRERHRLQDRFARAAQGGEEQSFAAEQRVLESADEFDVIGHGLFEGHDTAGVNLQYVARAQVEVNKIAPAVDEHTARAGQLLQNEAFPAKDSGPHPLGEGDSHVYA